MCGHLVTAAALALVVLVAVAPRSREARSWFVEVFSKKVRNPYGNARQTSWVFPLSPLRLRVIEPALRARRSAFISSVLQLLLWCVV